MPNQDSPEQPVPDFHGQLLARLRDGWVPPPYRLGSVIQVRRDNLDIPHYCDRPRVEDDKIIFRWRQPASISEALQELVRHNRDDSIKPLNAELSDHQILDAKESLVQSTGGTKGNEGFRDITVIGYEWQVRNETSNPLLWVVQTKNPRRDYGSGNLRIDTKFSYSRGHLRLAGKYTYYFLETRHPKTTWLVIDSGGELLTADLDRLHWEISALQFTLGFEIALKSVYGIDDGFQTCALFTTSYSPASGQAMHGFTPVSAYPGAHSWHVPFFKTLCSAAVGEFGLILKEVMWKYIQSNSATDFDTIFFHLANGLERLCNSYIQIKGFVADVLDVQSENAWRQWLDQEMAAIYSISKPDRSDDFYQRMLHAVTPSTRSRVSWVLKNLDLPSPPDVLRALEFFEKQFRYASTIDIADLKKLVNSLRPPICAIISRIIGYRGPLAEPEGRCARQGDTWWLDDTSNDSSIIDQWFAKAEIPALELARWPTFTPPRIPRSDLLESLASFGQSLADKTDGEVIGRLQVVPGGTESKCTLDFKLVIVESPRNQVLLFSVKFQQGQLEIVDWQQESIFIENTEQLGAFLKKLAHSRDVRMQVERLLQFAREIEAEER